MDAEFTAFGEAAALRVRAEKLDESLQVLDALWSGGPVRFAGRLGTIVATISDQRGGLSAFDVAVEGRTTPPAAARVVAAYAEAGLTWWVEAVGWWRGGISEARSRIAAGPPSR